jgi:hypothetical protein
MPSGPATWLLGAAIAAAAAAWFRYGVREERVRGRLVPALVWALALFFLISGLLLPPLRRGPEARSPRTVLIDLSASMDLPVAVGAGARSDSARVRALRENPELWIGFGREAMVAPPNRIPGPGSGEEPGTDLFRPDSPGIAADRSGSRLAPALRAARAAGADSVLLVTDGELEDREAARREAARLGLGVREIRVAEPTIRTTVREVLHPRHVTAGDTISFRVEVWTPGTEYAPARRTPADSVTILVSTPEGEIVSRSIERPAPGRAQLVEMRLPTSRSGVAAEWRRFGVRLALGADPLDAQPERSAWIEVSPILSGPVIVSVDPDWEAGHLLPVLNRASSDGARAYLRIGPDRWVRAGSTPETATLDRVRADATASDFLVVQGNPGELPNWLRTIAGRHDRLLFLARGPGPVPGTGVAIGPPLDGEWFLSLPPAPSPIGRSLSGLDAGSLPPAFTLRQLQGPVAWPVVEFRRDRRGDAVPGVVGIVSGARRTAIVTSEGTWRWSARTGSSRAVYRALFAGLSAWLLEEVRRTPVTFAPGDEAAEARVGWDVAPGVSELLIVVRDSSGAEIWRREVDGPEPRLEAPPLPSGDLTFEASGRLDGGSFSTGHPFSVTGPVAELAGRTAGRSLTIDAARRGTEVSRRIRGGAGRAVWPFALAAFLFCVEWFLRRRIGLR